MERLKVLLTGAGGLLGRALICSAPLDVQLVALTKQELNITQALQVENVTHALKPDVIINAAAYTQVDKAEQESEQAYAVNRDGVAHLAEFAAQKNIPLIHISTDHVFSGVAGADAKPYTELDKPQPCNVYGASKLAGEKALLEKHKQALIIRTSSVFSSVWDENGADFVSWVLKLARQKSEVSVVDDWISCPTPVESLAEVIWFFAQQLGELNDQDCAKSVQLEHRIVHYAGTPAVSRYQWAKAIVAVAQEKGIVQTSVRVVPCAVADLPAFLAKRPHCSALDCRLLSNIFHVQQPSWLEVIKSINKSS